MDLGREREGIRDTKREGGGKERKRFMLTFRASCGRYIAALPMYSGDITLLFSSTDDFSEAYENDFYNFITSMLQILHTCPLPT